MRNFVAFRRARNSKTSLNEHILPIQQSDRTGVPNDARRKLDYRERNKFRQLQFIAI